MEVISMSRKILVAYDGSSFSKRAIDEAKSQLALVPDTKLHVIAVAERTGPMTNKVLADAFTDDQVEYARKLIAEVEEHFAKESTRLNSSHVASSYAVFCLKKTKVSST